ncbi:MAG: Pimeloyl-[acyl-carrier protein] methyl ester esterase [Candidatus Celerinatantimonas neptuna]|nr:MAG: Pimeloyl-[acyl-carrier protein] methyl ester esterase [Candidatus Celerinatantimonas neptuna]
MKLYIEEKGEGIPLILLHGWGMNSGVWSTIAGKLAHSYRVYLVDLPGYGLSQPSEDLSFEQTARLLADQLPCGYWLGWSLGGLLSQKVAIGYPDKVMKLITVASSATFVERQDWPGMKANVLSLFAKGLEQDYRRTLERFLAIQMLGSTDAKMQIRIIKEQLASKPQPDLLMLRRGLQWLESIDLRTQIMCIEQPWLQLFGALDSLVPKQSAGAHQACSRAVQQIFAKASHAPFISHSGEFVQSITKFLQG